MPRKEPASIGVSEADKRHLEAFSRMNGDADWWWIGKLCLRYGIEHAEAALKENGDTVAQRVLEYLRKEGIRQP